jgi:hypothetical protein
MTIPGKDFDPTIHEYQVRSRGLEGKCKGCGQHALHHFHTGIYGPSCGCQDCMPLDTRKLNRFHPRAWFGRPRA